MSQDFKEFVDDEEELNKRTKQILEMYSKLKEKENNVDGRNK